MSLSGTRIIQIARLTHITCPLQAGHLFPDCHAAYHREGLEQTQGVITEYCQHGTVAKH